MSLVATRAELVPGLRTGCPDESLVFIGTSFRDLEVGQLEGEKRMGHEDKERGSFVAT